MKLSCEPLSPAELKIQVPRRVSLRPGASDRADRKSRPKCASRSIVTKKLNIGVSTVQLNKRRLCAVCKIFGKSSLLLTSRSCCVGILGRTSKWIKSSNDAIAFARGGLQRLAINNADLPTTVFDGPTLLQLLRKQGYRR